MNASAHTDLVRLWLCRIFSTPKTRARLYTNAQFRDTDVASYMGFDHWLDLGGKKFRPEIVRKELEEKHKALEARAGEIGLGPEIEGNFRNLAEMVKLNEKERRVLVFLVVFMRESILVDTLGMMGNIDPKKYCAMVAAALACDYSAVAESLSSKSRLIQSGLVKMESGSRYMHRLPMFCSGGLADSLLSEVCDREKLLSPIATPAPRPELNYGDYPHVKDTLSLIRPYLRKALQSGRRGVNLFLYGPPGCGKTQLSRILAREMRCKLFEISCQDHTGNPIPSKDRLNSLQLANNVIGHRNLLAFEEAEDVFNDGGLFMPSTAATRKAWMNRMLETNRIPTIWIANQVEGLDSANARRFDFVLELPVPPRKQREKVIRKACSQIASQRVIDELAKVDALAPAVVHRAAEVIRTVGETLPADKRDAALQGLIANTLKAQGAGRALKKTKAGQLPGVYDLAYLNADTDLRHLGETLKTHPKCRMVLYGPPGTGKTCYAHHLADQLGLPIIGKRASDILGPYVGQTEQNLARAFEEASRDSAILLLDEVDSFLRDRQQAVRSWEVTQTNEFLTQMEAFDGIFIASTNLMGNLDQASLRRFDLKLEFGYLQPHQSQELFVAHCKALKLAPPRGALPEQAAALEGVTPGDYANVARQHRFLGFSGPEAFLEAVNEECRIKGSGKKEKLGFN